MKYIDGGVCAAKGFMAGGVACGIKKTGKLDLALVYSEVPAQAAAVFTTNRVKAAPVQLSMKHIQSGLAQAIIANSGNANACVGPQGDATALAMCQAAAEYLKVPVESVLVASTGVIGVRLPVEKIQDTLKTTPGIVSKDGNLSAAQAIMTTDTFKKEAAVEIELGKTVVRIGGMAKGSGMIHPNMATMLGFVTTDAAIDLGLLQQALKRAADISFNRVTVDGDTSTNDCLFVLANGQAGNEKISLEGPEYEVFCAGLEAVCLELAKMLARDGEGATKLVEIRVEGAKSEAEAVQVGKAIATSSLVKTAIFGEDANWGRILAAAGYSGVAIQPELVDIYLGDLLVCSGGTGLVFDEEKAKAILSQKEITIVVKLGQGDTSATVWTCDLTYDYVKINGSYRT
ncbi:MAG TPA: bifunctional glutamate N-acetyltransferase/amino-acid acetyltransferase ArgJ [Bacillota bacterium]|nr:bifunctional glutamate N-acetyltransferase/amino-acid acetyltransferase ArgJ [Bacillota bacterium]